MFRGFDDYAGERVLEYLLEFHMRRVDVVEKRKNTLYLSLE